LHPEIDVGKRKWLRRVEVVPFLIVAALFFVPSSVFAGPPFRVLTTAKQVRGLPPDQARLGQAVRVRGKVLVLSGWKNSFFISDGGVGISIDRHDILPELHSGDEVEVVGKSAAGLFAPIIVSDRIRVLGKADLPPAPRRDYPELAGGTEDSQWVQVRGVVHSAWIAQRWGRSVLFLSIDLGGTDITAQVHDFSISDPSFLVDAVVSARGVCGTNFNERRQLVGLRLFVADMNAIAVEKPAPANPFSLPLRALNNIQRFSPGRQEEHRVRVSGTVTYQRIGEILYVQDGDEGMYIGTAQSTSVAVGTRIDAVGFSAPGAYSPQLRAAIFRDIGRGSTPAPIPLRAWQVIRTNADGFLTSPYDALLVRLRGHLVERISGMNQEVLAMRDGDQLFRAYLPKAPGSDGLSGLRIGSDLELTGVASIQSDESREPRSFELELRSPGDIVIIQVPSWWDQRHALFILSFVALAALGSLIWVALLRRQVRQQEAMHQSLAALAESEERFQVMANSIPQLVWMAEADGHIFWYNQRWYEYTGTTFEQMEGWAWQTVLDPAMLPKVLDRWKMAISGGTPFEMEFPLRGADGRFGIFLTRVTPTRNSEGHVVRWFGTNTDISDRKQAEVQLAGQAQELVRRAEELASSRVALETQTLMLQSVLDSMGEGLIAADQEGNFLIWNDSANKLMGRNTSNLPTEQLMGRNASNLPIEQWTFHYKIFLPDGITPYPPDRLPLVRALHGESVQVELMVEHPDRASKVCLEVTARPLKDNQGNMRGGVAVLRDITERKTAEREVQALNQNLEARVIDRTAELKAANEELEAFTYSVSHDLRAPLRHISGFTKILVEKFHSSLPAEAQRHLRLIEQGAHRMGQLVDELLKLARLGRQALEVEVTGLSSLVNDVVTLLTPEIEGRQVEWKIDELPFVKCDPILIRQVFQNLISNALKYSRPRSTAVIEIGQTEKGGEKVIFVKDNGVGFHMKYSDKLFGVFQRLHRAEEFEGTGVGLAMVERIIKKHGGRIWAEAELDRGATFCFTLGGGEHSVLENAAAAAGGSL
jgi:PAS domain S-box-containing protein